MTRWLNLTHPKEMPYPGWAEEGAPDESKTERSITLAAGRMRRGLEAGEGDFSPPPPMPSAAELGLPNPEEVISGRGGGGAGSGGAGPSGGGGGDDQMMVDA